MDPTAYLKTSRDMLMAARAETLEQAIPLLAAVDARVAELRLRLESTPVRSDDLREDCGGILCEIRGLLFVRNLVRAAKEHVDALGG